ncbi:hypothetical protein BU14_0126s0009 [Porphyra umbilicalis]|uniref:Uncharacterized protein n=1 Tax=Porphyra umbilicalis TaxID=2786 RepID=A0A1X6PB36_PORUM|nr:hypothetical protein BU14_0126s0009 [Porphyra umbilicalis]|eukprot:OSX77970.1 hypothetical protein BU14_0126s0009 [Porphyra umbilicalis]
MSSARLCTDGLAALVVGFFVAVAGRWASALSSHLSFDRATCTRSTCCFSSRSTTIFGVDCGGGWSRDNMGGNTGSPGGPASNAGGATVSGCKTGGDGGAPAPVGAAPALKPWSGHGGWGPGTPLLRGNASPVWASSKIYKGAAGSRRRLDARRAPPPALDVIRHVPHGHPPRLNRPAEGPQARKVPPQRPTRRVPPARVLKAVKRDDRTAPLLGLPPPRAAVDAAEHCRARPPHRPRHARVEALGAAARAQVARRRFARFHRRAEGRHEGAGEKHGAALRDGRAAFAKAPVRARALVLGLPRERARLPPRRQVRGAEALGERARVPIVDAHDFARATPEEQLVVPRAQRRRRRVGVHKRVVVDERQPADGRVVAHAPVPRRPQPHQVGPRLHALGPLLARRPARGRRRVANDDRQAAGHRPVRRRQRGRRVKGEAVPRGAARPGGRRGTDAGAKGRRPREHRVKDRPVLAGGGGRAGVGTPGTGRDAPVSVTCVRHAASALMADASSASAPTSASDTRATSTATST